jgi:hypothetical protein
MATPVWPPTLPQKPLLSNHSFAPQDNKVTFQPETGPSIDRRRGTAAVQKYQATFPPLTAAQVAVFEAFYQEELMDGALHYLWPDPVSGAAAKWKIREYSFASQEAGRFDLSMQIDRLPGAAV